MLAEVPGVTRTRFAGWKVWRKHEAVCARVCGHTHVRAMFVGLSSKSSLRLPSTTAHRAGHVALLDVVLDVALADEALADVALADVALADVALADVAL